MKIAQVAPLYQSCPPRLALYRRVLARGPDVTAPTLLTFAVADGLAPAAN